MRVLPITARVSTLNNRKTKTNHMSNLPFGGIRANIPNVVRDLEHAGVDARKGSELVNSLKYAYRENSGMQSISQLLNDRNADLKIETVIDSARNANGTNILFELLINGNKRPLMHGNVRVEDGQVSPIVMEYVNRDSREQTAPDDIERVSYRLVDKLTRPN